MNEFKGYSGPWGMRIKDGMAIFDFNHNGETKHWRFAECVVSMAADDEPQDYLMANAHLIAAAPELLEALQIICFFEDISSAQREIAEAAIAKALGESQ